MKFQKRQSFVAVFIFMMLVFISLGCSMSSTWDRNAASEAEVSEVAQFNLDRTETAAAANDELPTQDIQPTYTFYPTYTEFPAEEATEEPTAHPVEEGNDGQSQDTDTENAAGPAEEGLTAEIEISGDEFFCDEEPDSITFRLDVNDINTGFALYYHLEDIASGAATDTEVVDIHRDKTETFRYLELIGDTAIVPGYYSAIVVDAPGTGPANLVYQIISDDNSFRSEKKADIVYYPCGYVAP